MTSYGQVSKELDEIYAGRFEKSLEKQLQMQQQHEELYRQATANGSKSISSMERKPSLSLQGIIDKIEQPTPTDDFRNKQQAEIELTFIRAAITMAKGSNDIGAEITIAGITIGVSINERLIPILEAEAHEIEKYLMGQPNNYE